MTKLEIEAFLAAVKFGSISLAAEQLYVTQPALSRRIQSLETELGYKLFVRDKGIRKITLTEHGKAFLSVANKWSNVYTEAMSIKNIDCRKVLQFAAVSSVSGYILPSVIREFLKSNECNINFHYCHSHEGYQLVDSGFVDFAIVDYIRKADINSVGNVLSTPLFSAPFVFVGGEQWKGIKEINPLDLDCANEIRLQWNMEFDKWHDCLFESSATPAVRLNQATLIGELLHGDLYCIMPEFVAGKVVACNSHFAVCNIKNGPPDEVYHCLSSVAAQSKEEVQQFVSMIQKEISHVQGVKCF